MIGTLVFRSDSEVYDDSLSFPRQTKWERLHCSEICHQRSSKTADVQQLLTSVRGRFSVQV